MFFFFFYFLYVYFFKEKHFSRSSCVGFTRLTILLRMFCILLLWSLLLQMIFGCNRYNESPLRLWLMLTSLIWIHTPKKNAMWIQSSWQVCNKFSSPLYKLKDICIESIEIMAPCPQKCFFSSWKHQVLLRKRRAGSTWEPQRFISWGTLVVSGCYDTKYSQKLKCWCKEENLPWMKGRLQQAGREDEPTSLLGFMRGNC